MKNRQLIQFVGEVYEGLVYNQWSHLKNLFINFNQVCAPG